MLGRLATRRGSIGTRPDKPGRLRQAAQTGLGVIPPVWLGMALGIGAIATPVKFTVADLDLDVAVQVGLAVFTVAQRVEWAFLLGLALCASVVRPHLGCWLTLAALGLFLAIQGSVLMPVLSDQVTALAQDRPMPGTSGVHQLYTLVELGKWGVLAAMAVIWHRPWQ